MGSDNLALTGVLSPDRPARSESLYRLSYPGPFSKSSAVYYTGTCFDFIISHHWAYVQYLQKVCLRTTQYLFHCIDIAILVSCWEVRNNKNTKIIKDISK
jgi:hypothetical protein